MRMNLNQCLHCGDLFEHVDSDLYFCDKCWLEMQIQEEVYREYRIDSSNDECEV